MIKESHDILWLKIGISLQFFSLYTQLKTKK